ncbi:MAG: DUF4298 domain-containing protein [Bacilli bacterium]|nr:DUF4298 domain-containing protein [Bacilli bacterium]
MIERITKNEERLDSIIDNVNQLNKALTNFNKEKKNIILLNNYYKSKNWIKDKDDYESGKIPKIKAGVLSEDLVWNTLENVDELLVEMEEIIKYLKR